MNTLCLYCHVLKFQKKLFGVCCSNDKIKFLLLVELPEPLISYVSSTTVFSNNFLENIRKYNLSFQMTSFGASNFTNNTGFSVFCLFFLIKKKIFLQVLYYYLKCKDKFTIKSVHFFQHKIKNQCFCKGISHEMKKKNIALLSTKQDVKLFQICNINIIIWLNYLKLPWIECHQMITTSL